jgi:hypothetical protein
MNVQLTSHSEKLVNEEWGVVDFIRRRKPSSMRWSCSIAKKNGGTQSPTRLKKAGVSAACLCGSGDIPNRSLYDPYSRASWSETGRSAIGPERACAQ